MANTSGKTVIGYVFESAGQSEAYECRPVDSDIDWKMVGCDKVALILERELKRVAPDESGSKLVEFEGEPEVMDAIIANFDGRESNVKIRRAD